jgi:DNA-binding FrmR family transcriptional regulator
MTNHTSHPDIIKRLKRAEGHLKSIITMLEDGRNCLDITQQLQAVESAVSNAKPWYMTTSTIALSARSGTARRALTIPSASSKPSPNTCEEAP